MDIKDMGSAGMAGVVFFTAVGGVHEAPNLTKSPESVMQAIAHLGLDDNRESEYGTTRLSGPRVAVHVTSAASTLGAYLTAAPQFAEGNSSAIWPSVRTPI